MDSTTSAVSSSTPDAPTRLVLDRHRHSVPDPSRSHPSHGSCLKMERRFSTNGNAVLVTGGAGYVGSTACKALARTGYIPVTFDNLASGNRWAVRWGPLELGDILDVSRLNEVCKKYRPVAIMHFAASALVGESMREPALYYRNNVAGALGLLDMARLHEITSFVFSSTCAIYGIP